MSESKVVGYRAKTTKNKRDIVLWLLQSLTALMFTFAGYQKGFGDLDVVVKNIFWVK